MPTGIIPSTPGGITRPPRLREWTSGDSITPDRLSEAPRAINKIVEHVFPPRQVVAPAKASSSTQVEVFRVSSSNQSTTNHGGDIIICKKMDSSGEITGDPIYVARPYLLRRLPFDIKSQGRNGISYNYTFNAVRIATDILNQTSITEVITPSYNSETGGSSTKQDQIVAMHMPSGVRTTTGAKIRYPTLDDVVVWLDLNVDGRAWAKESG